MVHSAPSEIHHNRARWILRLPLGRRHVRAAVGAAWVIAAILAAQPAGFTSDWWRFSAGQSAMGEPAAIRHSILWAVGIAGSHAVVFNILLVGLQAMIGLALIFGRAERLAILASVPLALGIWWIGEGFGALPTGFATFVGGAPGAVVLYPVLAFLAWPGTDAVREKAGVSPRLAKGLWLLLWCGQAALLLPWRFPSGQVLGATVEEVNAGPPWITKINDGVSEYLSVHGSFVMLALTILCVVIGLTIAFDRGRRTGLVVGCAVMALSWVVFQGAGGLLTGDATDLNTAPLVVLLAFAIWPNRQESDIQASDHRRSVRRSLSRFGPHLVRI
ncbi:MAG: hypothetical protein ACRD6W_15295 [Nitrososphaerales archaeon]